MAQADAGQALASEPEAPASKPTQAFLAPLAIIAGVSINAAEPLLMLLLWIKALHIIGVICWFAGIFYLPRLFVYHALTSDKVGNERFKIMERKLYRAIMWPSAVVTLVSGLGLLALTFGAFGTALWLHLKLALVAALLAYHLYCGHLVRVFAADQNHRSHKFYRIFNELPVLILIAIVILVVVKPFN